jgi:CNT family concentrative nucleoside transporter
MSTNRRAINWKTVGWAAALQLIFAVLILKTPWGKSVFNWLNDVVITLLGFQAKGAEMVFGELAKSDKLGYIFAFQVLPTIIFFSALMSFLYYIGAMQKVVKVFAWVMEKTCKISGAESLSAAANIFVGQTEAPLLIKPYVSKMTKSEIMCIMTGGMATVAGGVMAAYIMMLKDAVPGIAGHLMAASVMGAPAAIMFAKIIVPETEKPETLGVKTADYKDPSVNVIDAISGGTATGLQLALNVGAMLIAFTALIALASGILELIIHIPDIFGKFYTMQYASVGEIVQDSILFMSSGEGSLQKVLGYLFSPLSFFMGVPLNESVTAGSLLADKTILNEFVAYANFANMPKSLFSVKTGVILSYALCGFANFSSIGIQIGGISPLAPERRADLSRYGLYAMIAGLLTSCFRAAVVGLLI